jgi:hypothetical protein
MEGNVGTPAHLHFIAINLLVAVVNHEYQHDKWIGEVRTQLRHATPPVPQSARLVTTDGYLLLNPEVLCPAVQQREGPSMIGGTW